jgi:hypothetical protein
VTGRTVAQARPRFKRVPPRPASTALLHHLAAVLNLAVRRLPEADSAAPLRRRRQRLSLAQRLLNPLPAGLRSAELGSERFWLAIRWGGPGLLLGWWLTR